MKTLIAMAALCFGALAQADTVKMAPAAKTADPDGKALFASKCSACHGDNGRALSDYGKQHSIPDFTTADFGAKHTQKDLIATVTDGELEADMPAFGSQLSADQIKAVVAYVQKLAPKPAAK